MMDSKNSTGSKFNKIAENLKIAFLSSRFQYKDHTGQFRQDSADLLVMHFFNHQTHHRGQVHQLLTQSGTKEISLDLHRLIHPAVSVGQLVGITAGWEGEHLVAQTDSEDRFGETTE